MGSVQPTSTSFISSKTSTVTFTEALSSSSTSHVSALRAASGESLYKSSIIPFLISAQTEIILVTCFWAQSPTLSALSDLLIDLSELSFSRTPAQGKLRVRIGFSSRSLPQKFFHTSSPEGNIYPPSTWPSKLGLPAAEELQGLDLQIKSIFYLPFSVLHPKFVIVDRRHAILPSCNVSWENWLECCIHLSGPVVASLLDFWHETWGKDELPTLPSIPVTAPSFSDSKQAECQTTLLPSSHHRNPRFRPWLFTAPSPPPTPLNTYLLQSFASAEREIYLVTPNLTSPPVLSAILAALARNVDVQIVTNRRMMVLEQLLTAGAITELCIRRLIRKYERKAGRDYLSRAEENRELGRLSIGYFSHAPERGIERKCHIKCTIVDDKVVVLGSGNMDRASWYTSQELGVAIESKELVMQVKEVLSASLQGRVEMYYERP